MLQFAEANPNSIPPAVCKVEVPVRISESRQGSRSHHTCSWMIFEKLPHYGLIARECFESLFFLLSPADAGGTDESCPLQHQWHGTVQNLMACKVFSIGHSSR